VGAAVGVLGSELIVGSTEEPDVFGFRASALAARVPVIELQPGA
jgi:hypothetical protein